MHTSNWILALALSLLAGLSTGFGGLLAIMFRTTNKKFLSIALGFSAGIMIYISFMEILPDAKVHLISSLGQDMGGWVALVAFFAGILLIALIDKLIPARENPHEVHSLEEMDSCEIAEDTNRLMKVSALTAIAITVHNFPEGMVTFVSAMTQPKLGIAIALAVAIHNIPEGIAIAVPVYCATGSRKKAFLFSLFSGAAEPVGAFCAFLFLSRFLNESVLGIIFAVIAGIMVYISFDELLPTAREYGEHHLTIYGLLAGMLVMGIGLMLLF
jgi:ZIP family zinc transporter